MNSKGEENRSVRLTRKRLSDALITLLMQKPVREITVRVPDGKGTYAYEQQG